MVAKGAATVSDDPFGSIEEHFGDMADPRVMGRCEHKLVEIIVIAICGVLCGAEGWIEIEEFGQAKEEWLRQFLALENGIPSHDTFGRVFSLLDAKVFQERFARWVESVFVVTRGQVVAVDGKTARRSHDQAIGKDAIHLVSAWASANGLLLGQRKVDQKSNEITAIPELLKLLYVAGCIVTIDAMGCQTDIAQAIVDQKADYILALKGNQGQLHTDVQEWFAWAQQTDFKNMTHSFHQTVNKNHGRIEIRRCWAIADPLAFENIRHHDGWAGLQSIVMLQRERRTAGRTQSETAYYISSLKADAKLLLDSIRTHWTIENTFHWSMDVTFREDDSRIRLGDSPENLAVVRHLALNLLKRHPANISLKRKRFRAALDDQFLFELLSHV
jgi:predicted transposase YbfD/YdcC